LPGQVCGECFSSAAGAAMLPPSAPLWLRLAPHIGKGPQVRSLGLWRTSHPAHCSIQGWVPLPHVVCGPMLRLGAQGSRFSPSRKRSAAAGTSPYVEPEGRWARLEGVVEAAGAAWHPFLRPQHGARGMPRSVVQRVHPARASSVA